MFCFPNVGHVIILWRTVSFNFGLIHVLITRECHTSYFGKQKKQVQEVCLLREKRSLLPQQHSRPYLSAKAKEDLAITSN